MCCVARSRARTCSSIRADLRESRRPTMTRFNKEAAIALLAGLMTTTLLVPARADVKDFEFQLVQNELKKGDAIVVVRLVDKRTKKPVPNAVIFAKRIDMAPDGMATMAEKVEELPSTVPGEYRFKTNL